MTLPDGRPVVFDDGVLLDSAAGARRLVFWLPDEDDHRGRRWERVGVTAHVAATCTEGLCSITATSVPTRERTGSPLGRLLGRLRSQGSERIWRLPNGVTVEQCGPRRADQLLAWPEDEAAPIDEARVRARWPGCQRVRSVGRNLVLVSGIQARPSAPAPEEPVAGAVAQEAPLSLAERALASARAVGDPRQVVSALADLGLACLNARDAQRAVHVLEEALAAARRLGDPGREVDVACGLGQTLTFLGEPGRARGMLAEALALARSVGDRYAEKIALDQLGQAHAFLGDHAGALALFEQALALAAGQGDRFHEADLFWLAAIAHVELGHRERATPSTSAGPPARARRPWPCTSPRRWDARSS